MAGKGRKKTGSEILFEKLAKNSIDGIVEYIWNPLYWCLKDAAEGKPGFYRNNDLIPGHNEIVAYLVLESMGLIRIPHPIKSDQPFKLTEDGRKVYDSLVNEGAYKRDIQKYEANGQQ